MATRRFCDRCDKQLKSQETKHITLPGNVSRTDLCNACFDELVLWFNTPPKAKRR